MLNLPPAKIENVQHNTDVINQSCSNIHTLLYFWVLHNFGTYILIIKTSEMHYFSIFFGIELLHVSDSSILISLADSQHNMYDKYILLCIQY